MDHAKDIVKILVARLYFHLRSLCKHLLHFVTNYRRNVSVDSFRIQTHINNVMSFECIFGSRKCIFFCFSSISFLYVAMPEMIRIIYCSSVLMCIFRMFKTLQFMLGWDVFISIPCLFPDFNLKKKISFFLQT